MSKAETFKTLHQQSKPFVLPNAWNAGSARMMEMAGFDAIATTSAGIAFSHGLPDGNHLAKDIVFDEVRKIVEAVNLPVTTDIETGYDDMASTILLVKIMGVVGVNIEDTGGRTVKDLFDLYKACDNITLAKETGGKDFVINARTDPYLVGHPFALKESILRGNAYVEAGADCVFVPGVNDINDIKTLVNEINAPLNILAGVGPNPFSHQELADCGVKRISTGGSLARRTYATLENILKEIKDGSFNYAVDAIPDDRMNDMLS